jgi:hypothetical protein
MKCTHTHLHAHSLNQSSDFVLKVFFFFIPGVGWDWTRLVRRVLVSILYQPRMIDDYGAFIGIRSGRGNRSTRRKTALVPNLTWCNLESNPDRRDGKPTTVRLSSSTALRSILKFVVQFSSVHYKPWFRIGGLQFHQISRTRLIQKKTQCSFHYAAVSWQSRFGIHSAAYFEGDRSHYRPRRRKKGNIKVDIKAIVCDWLLRPRGGFFQSSGSLKGGNLLESVSFFRRILLYGSSYIKCIIHISDNESYVN